MNYQKISQKIFFALAALWVILLLFPMELGYRYIYIGLLIFYLGLQNIILLNLGQRSGQPPEKLAAYQERLGTKKGLIYYATFAAIYIIIGLIFVYSGYTALP